MRKPVTGLALLPLLALGACAVAPPSGPSVVAMPGQGKDWAQFQHDDAVCRQYAQSRMPDAGQTMANSQNNSAATTVTGGALGAAAGAALGSISGNVGTGAAVGAIAGLLGGAAVAGNGAQATAQSLQGRYDVAYAQCMVGHGETIEQPPAPPVVYYAQPPVYYPPAPGYYYGPGW